MPCQLGFRMHKGIVKNGGLKKHLSILFLDKKVTVLRIEEKKKIVDLSE